MKTPNLQIARNILLPMVAGGLVLLSLIVFADIGLNSLGGLMSAVIDKNAERTVLALGALDDINIATIKEKNTLLERGDAKVAILMGEYGELMESALQKLDQLKSLTGPDDLSPLLAVTDLALQYRNLMEQTEFPFVKQGNIGKALEISFSENEGGGRALRQKIRADLQTIVEKNRNEMREYGQEAKATSARTKDMLVLVASSGLAIALIWISVVQIVGPRKNKMSKLEELANGNLDIEIDGVERKDEVAAVVRALELFRDNAAKDKRLAEAEEKEYGRKLQALKKDSD